MPESGTAARTARPIHGKLRATLLRPEDALRAPEHHPDEENERTHLAPLDSKEQPDDRDEFRKDECCYEAADEVAEPAEHADQECDRAERQTDRGMDVVLQHEQARGEPCERSADCGRDHEQP